MSQPGSYPRSRGQRSGDGLSGEPPGFATGGQWGFGRAKIPRADQKLYIPPHGNKDINNSAADRGNSLEQHTQTNRSTREPGQFDDTEEDGSKRKQDSSGARMGSVQGQSGPEREEKPPACSGKQAGLGAQSQQPHTREKSRPNESIGSQEHNRRNQQQGSNNWQHQQRNQKGRHENQWGRRHQRGFQQGMHGNEIQHYDGHRPRGRYEYQQMPTDSSYACGSEQNYNCHQFQYDPQWNPNHTPARGAGGHHRGRWSDPVSPDSPYVWPGNKRWEDDDIVFLSKTLSYILRHGATKQGYELLPGGFLYVQDILDRTHKLKGYTVKDVEKVVANNDKQRFALKIDGNGKLMIRANQGHTMEVEDLELTPITSPDQFSQVIHGTYFNSWEIIKKKGLSKMTRNHIHFAAGEPGQNQVISGMRTSCEVMIFIDMEKALGAGLKFFLSANNVILSPGDKDGIIYPCFFACVLQRNPRQQLQFDSTISSGGDPPKARKEKKKKNKHSKRVQEDRDSKRQKFSANDDEDEVDGDCSVLFREDGEEEEPENWDDESKEGTGQNSPQEDRVSSDKPEEVGETETPRNGTLLSDTAQVTVATGELSVQEGTSLQSVTCREPNQQPSTSSERSMCHAERLNQEPPVPAERQIDPLLTEMDCKTKLEMLLTEKPSALAVTYIGQKLGTEESKIQLVALTGGHKDYVIHLEGNQAMSNCFGDFITQGKIPMVFNGLKEFAKGFCQEFDILMVGEIRDVQILYDHLKDALSSNERQELKQVQGTPEVWSKENREMVFSGDMKASGEKLVQHGQKILQYFNLLNRHEKTTEMREAKKKIYGLVRFDEDHWLAEKYQKLKPGKESKKKSGAQTDQAQRGQPQGKPSNKGKKNKGGNKKR